ncbi:hypothetical protein SUGI_0889990 [Cryptomeria japonica]|uniref:LRR receptor-like serine/threonine-protein kinase SIK1 n=1 Tax=Cryptomeria japonica TaxID=3369 RepID=UPI002414886A|nr:LRR receptor-like serine/threonine-protein kinase SIK1 [Cryptomeria japonica]GLJ42914.1 hypothetical protein SUGI_0889990 [Cryptomeria japonica]
MELETIGFGFTMRKVLFVMLVLQKVVWTETMLDPLDFLSLQALRKSLDDMPGSKFFKSWDFSSDPCGFSGVLCDSNRVVALNLGDSSAGAPGLKGKLDGALGCLGALVELTVVPGQVSGSIPETMGQLKELQFMGISKNFLSGRIPPCLGSLTKLQTLDLSFNQLVGSIPKGIGQLPTLSNLILGHNKLSGPIPTCTSSLRRLDLKHNGLSGTLPSLPNSVQYVSLANNLLSGSIDELSGLQQLSYLDLSFNQFSGSIPGALFSFKMTSLFLQRNSFSGSVNPQGQVMIPNVDLSFNFLTGPIPSSLAYVQNLYLNNNHFTGAVPSEFIDRLLSANIQVLYIQHNYLTQITLKPSTMIPLTSSLCIQYNCMVPPIQPPCPFKVGKQKKRPTYQCNYMG